MFKLIYKDGKVFEGNSIKELFINQYNSSYHLESESFKEYMISFKHRLEVLENKKIHVKTLKGLLKAMIKLEYCKLFKIKGN